MRVEKTVLATHISQLVEDSSFLYFISYKGLTVAEFAELRGKLAGVGAKCQVLKNSLIRIGLEKNNIEIPSHFDNTGDTAVVIGDGDPCPVGKQVKEFGKKVEFVSLKGVLLNGVVLTKADTMMLADLPSKDALRSQMIGVLQAPMSNLVRLMNAKLASIVYLLQAYKDKKENLS